MTVDFALNVRKWAESVPGKVELVTYAIGEAVVERVKELTPVDTGFLRSSWVLVTEEQLTRLESASLDAAGSLVGDVTAAVTKKALAGVTRFGGVAGMAVGFATSAVIGDENAGIEEMVGSLAGGVIGAQAGAAIGAAAFGIGALPGAIVGGAIGSFAGAFGGGLLSGRTFGTILYVINPAPYARRIEYGFVGEDSLGRTYDYKGVGMMQQTLAELPAIADRVISGLRL